MTRLYLQDMVDDISFDTLPVNWITFDRQEFSATKKLWDYQQEALVNAVKVLWKYYEDFADFTEAENPQQNNLRKEKFFQWYQDNGLDEDLDINLSRVNRNISQLLADYYEPEDKRVSYQNFINRMSFWMATGSGKSLVIIKLIQVLRNLIERKEIPAYDILVLTHRDDLIEQLKRHVNEFNSAHSDIFIKLRELKEYATAKREYGSLFKEREVTVFYYRSDNLSDEQKEKIIDFRSYDDEGKWYIFLDEAHKGDREDSKRQQIYSILSRNGFLFNFSATFTDVRDLVTAAFDFNLSKFIKDGYGKHISLLQQEIRAFRDEEDYNNDEKQKIVLKSLMMLTYANKFYQKIQIVQAGLYHKPLLLTLVNSVNTEEADLKLFFRELECIGKGKISEDVWRKAQEELWGELQERPSFLFEDGDRIEIHQGTFQSLQQSDILESVYNTSASGETEILIRPSNRQELAFKLRTSDKPFALIKIGDISGWLKDELAGYEINERFEDEGYFEQLNQEVSDINILMGSRSFYEGWDSNRPNVINFINIGTGTDARKFILQSVGRGVRIEPLQNKRKRLHSLYNSKDVEDDLFNKLKEKISAIETLFIFGTNRNALKTVMEHLEQERRKEDVKQLSLFVNKDAVRGRRLLIPTYKLADNPLIEQRELAKFEITNDEFSLLKRYVEFVQDERVLVSIHNTEPKSIGFLRDSLNQPDSYYRFNERPFKNINLMVSSILNYFNVVPEKYNRLKKLEDEIKHFRNIKIILKDITESGFAELRHKVEKVGNHSKLAKELKAQYGKISQEDYLKKAQQLSASEQFESKGKKIQIKYIANHYYLPLILSDEEKVDYIKHIIKTPSEVKFINDLEKYLTSDNKFKSFDWWLFSKLDESLDEVYMPYYNPKSNRISHFKPDFIFWLQRGQDYFIVFIDPKGIEHADYQHKIDGYRQIFEIDSGKKRVFNHDELKVKVFTFLYTDDVNQLPDNYRHYWLDNIDKSLNYLIEQSKTN